MRLAAAIVLSFVAIAGAACAERVDMDPPPIIRYGEAVCDQCSMIISDERFAAAYRTGGGDARQFGDIGDMLVFHTWRKEAVDRFWVHDSDSLVWIDAAASYFMVAEELATPMGHGIAAYSTRQRATEEAAKVDGLVFEWPDMIERYRSPSAGRDEASSHFH